MAHLTDHGGSYFGVAVRKGRGELLIGLGKPKYLDCFFESAGVGRGHGKMDHFPSVYTTFLLMPSFFFMRFAFAVRFAIANVQL